MLRAAIRPYDICVRYAGDEFIVVLSGCGADEAERKRVELQTAIDEVVFEARPGKRLQLGHQHRRGRLPARRQHLRDAARDGRQPDVPRQDEAEARGRERSRAGAVRKPMRHHQSANPSCNAPPLAFSELKRDYSQPVRSASSDSSEQQGCACRADDQAEAIGYRRFPRKVLDEQPHGRSQQAQAQRLRLPVRFSTSRSNQPAKSFGDNAV